MNEFNLEYQYKLFLQRMALDESKMHPEQKKQIKQTFFGAVGQTLILLRDDMSKLEEDKATEVLQSLLNQVSDYFLQITNRKS